LYREIVKAIERGMTKTEAAHLFGANLSSVKRDATSARDGKPLAPNMRPRLIEENLKRRLAASLGKRRGYLGATFGR